MKKVACFILIMGCSGEEFGGTGVSTVSDASQDTENDINTHDGPPDVPLDTVDVQNEVSDTFEGSVVIDVNDTNDAEFDTSTVPTCPAEEAYPADSPTCRRWIMTTPYPLYQGCCRIGELTCGYRVSFSPYCIALP